MRYYINIGTNLGDKEKNIKDALLALERSLGVYAVAVSDSVKSKAWGFESNNTFLNVAIAIDSVIEPLAMLSTLKRIEEEVGTSVHRNANGEYCDRIIDLDIMAIEEQVISLPELHVPHLHLSEREFFLIPFYEIAPNWQHPLTGLSLGEMLQSLVGDKPK